MVAEHEPPGADRRAPLDARRALLAFACLALLVSALVLGFTGAPRGEDARAPAAPASASSTAARDERAHAAPLTERQRAAALASAAAPAPQAVDGTLTLRVSTRERLSGRAPGVPRVPVEAGVGAPFDPSTRPLTSAVTDALGEARLELAWSDVEAARDAPHARLWVRVAGAGWQRRTRAVPLPATPEPLDVHVIAFAGGTLLGRLVDADGAALCGTARARTWAPTGGLGFGPAGSAGHDGWFEIDLTAEGTYQLLAEATASPPGPFGASGQGVLATAALADCAVRFTSPPQVVELVASGPGVVRGRVRDAAGRPAADLQVLALVAELDDERGSFVLPEPRASRLALEGRGRTWAEARTDASGAFELVGLRDDLYVVRARTTPFGGYPLLLTPRPVPADGAALELVLDRPHLVVRLVAADGGPLPAGLEPEGHGPSMPGEDWPERPALVVSPVPGEAHLRDERTTYVGGRRLEDGAYVFEVEDGRRYLVGVRGGPVSGVTREVAVPPGASRIDVTLPLESAASRGALVISLFDRDGPAAGSLELSIEEAASGLPLVVPGWRAYPVRVELPEGRYRVVAEGRPGVDFHHGTLWSEREHGRAATEVEVLPDVETPVRLDLPAGARLRLRVEGEVSEADRAAVRERYALALEEDLAAWAARASLALLSEGAWPQPVDFRFEVSGSSAAGTHVASALALGAEQLSEVAAAGRYTLVGRLPGGRVASVPVVLVDGEVAEATLRFE